MPPIYRNERASHYFAPLSARADPRIRGFHERLPGYVPTDLVSLPAIADKWGVGHVLVKKETSRFGLPAFKILGAAWAAYRALTGHLGLALDATRSLDDLAQEIKGQDVTLFAATDGNHGRAVARMAALLQVRCEILVPQGLDATTIALIEGEGARVVQVPGDYDLAVQEAHRSAGLSQGGILIQDTAFEGYEEIPQWIVDGYSTMLTELDEQVARMTDGRAPDVVFVPVGVGSLAQAVVARLKVAGRPQTTTVVTVEPDTAACLKTALLGASQSPPVEPSNIVTAPTIMEGLCCGTVSPLAWPLLRDGVDIAVSVADIETHRAVCVLRAEGVYVGPCGAAPLAALGRLVESQWATEVLRPDSVVVLLATEGPRPYSEPLDATATDPVLLTQILTRIDSSNPDLSVGDGAGESAIVGYLYAWLVHHGFEAHRLEANKGRPSIVGIARGTGGGKALMFNGHIDTVTLAGYDGNPLSGDIIDGAVHGRGSYDMKAGIAASLIAALHARQTDQLKGDIVLALVADEENLSLGTQEVLAEGWRADGAVICEPTNHELMLSHKGFVWAEVDIVGKAGHGSRPDLCVDAIVKAGHFLVALERYGDALMSGQLDDAVVHSHLRSGTVHAGLIKGGEEISSYPARCTVTVERRTVPGETVALVERQLREILETLTRSVQNFRYVLRMGDSRPPFEIGEDHDFSKLFKRCANSVLEEEVRVTGASYWADSALLAAEGIPIVLLGMKGQGAHAAQECAEVDSIEKVTRILTKVATEFCC